MSCDKGRSAVTGFYKPTGLSLDIYKWNRHVPFVFPNYITDGATTQLLPSVMLYIKKIKTHLIIRAEHNETMGDLQTLLRFDLHRQIS